MAEKKSTGKKTHVVAPGVEHEDLNDFPSNDPVVGVVEVAEPVASAAAPASAGNAGPIYSGEITLRSNKATVEVFSDHAMVHPAAGNPLRVEFKHEHGALSLSSVAPGVEEVMTFLYHRGVVLRKAGTYGIPSYVFKL